jgi:DNA-directed RNA polymerase specialized sigma24 family protein
MRDAVRHAAGTHSGDGGGGPSAQSDAAVIRQSLRSPEIFGELFDRHAPAIHRYVTRRLGPDVADDLVAETFLTAFRKRAAFRAEHADARPWLYGIATRLIARQKRDEVRKLRAIARTGHAAPGRVLRRSTVPGPAHRDPH